MHSVTEIYQSQAAYITSNVPGLHPESKMDRSTKIREYQCIREWIRVVLKSQGITRESE